MDKIKFLMSDTGAEITAACREALEQKGVEVTVVEKDGLKVLQKMLAVRPQVVLLDAFMPGLDALAVKQKYNAAGERHTSFFVTGAFQSEEMVQALRPDGGGGPVRGPSHPAAAGRGLCLLLRQAL
jgi:two-component system response regulator (stage 0 sporulation protein A)